MRTVKLTKLALVLVIPALALLLLGQSARPPAVEAKPTSLLTISYILCFTLNTDLDWDGSTVVESTDATTAFFACQNLNNESEVRNMVRALGGDEEHPKPEDFTTAAVGRTPTDSDGGQLHEKDGQLWAMAFVSNDNPVSFYADEGVFYKSGRSDIACGLLPSPDYDVTDEDCNGNGVRGDGVVAVSLIPKGADRGPATLKVRQDKMEEETEYVVTGEAWNIELTAMKPVIQSGAATCALFKTTAAFMATLGAPAKTPVTAKVTDSDGTVLTYAQVAYKSDDPDMADFAAPLTPTLVSALGVLSPNVLCGKEDTGTVTIRATISHGVKEGIITNPSARERHAEVEIKVQGPPTNMVLSASPSSLVCDGTAESTVSATLTDAEGNPAVDGNIVRFDVKALGIASPIEAKSAAGAATTKVTPLSDIAKGVTVKATLLLTEGEEVPVEEPVPNPTPTPTIEEVLVPDIEKSILVECASAPGAPAPGAPAAGGAPAISPPATGDGGYLQGG
jgi:hypothetical protein